MNPSYSDARPWSATGPKMDTSTNANRPREAVDDWWDRHGVAAETTVSVYVRSYVPPPAKHDARRRLLNTLSFPQGRDRIRDHQFRVVGDELCLRSDCRPGYRDAGPVETVATLCAWTDGRLASSGFRTRSVDDGTTGERYRTLVPPETAVAVSREDALLGVFPCEVAGETYGLDAFLADLREAVIGERAARQEPVSADTRGDELITGEGSERAESRATDGGQNSLE